MAGGALVTGPGKSYPGNLTCRVFITCIVAATGGLIFGYDLGISGLSLSPPLSGSGKSVKILAYQIILHDEVFSVDGE